MEYSTPSVPVKIAHWSAAMLLADDNAPGDAVGGRILTKLEELELEEYAPNSEHARACGSGMEPSPGSLQMPEPGQALTLPAVASKRNEVRCAHPTAWRFRSSSFASVIRARRAADDDR